LDIWPHLLDSDSAPKDVVIEFMKRWCLDTKPHTVADAAFGSFDLIHEIENWGGYATFSISSNNTSWLWNILSSNLPCGCWRTAQHTNGFIASCSALIDKNGKRVLQHLFSNGFKSVISSEESSSSIVPSVSSSEMPIFTKEALLHTKLSGLKDICKKWHIKQHGNKAEIIENIVQRSNTIHQQFSVLDQLKRSIKSDWFRENAVLHEFYRSHFNLIDLVNKRWGSVEEHHHHQQWKTKMILTILQFAVINLWTYGTKIKWEEWLQFRENAALAFVNYRPK
jgi:hypothetical protein